MIVWTVFIWIATPIGIHFYGFNAFAAITAIINVSVIPLIVITKRYVHFQTLSVIKNPLICSVIMGIILYFSTKLLVHDIFTLLLAIAIGIVSYFGSLYLLAKDDLLSDIAFIKQNLR